jgi:hypothetical protein
MNEIKKFFTVGELIDRLQNYPRDMPVSLCFDENGNNEPELQPVIDIPLIESGD